MGIKEDRFQERLGYRFSNSALFVQALTHKSFRNENPGEARKDNERLEFLGDAVLELVVSEMLMENFPDVSEGYLSKARAALVSEPSLADIAQDMGVGELLRIGRGEEISGGREKYSLLSDALEAVFAAVYLDSQEEKGFKETRRVIEGVMAPRMEVDRGLFKDFKTELQEWMQKNHKDTVRYRIVDEEGPDHEKSFVATATFQNVSLGEGEGKTKKKAQQEAARVALERLKKEGLEALK